jgi:hypothetical protein
MVSLVVSNVIIHFVMNIQVEQNTVEHADRCFPLIPSDPVSGDARDSKLVRFKLNQVGFRQKAKLSLKEKNDLKSLYTR